MVRQSLIAGIGAVTLVVATSSSASASGPILADHPMLVASLGRISLQSATWRAALDAVENTRRRVVVVTPEKVRMRDGSGGPDTPFDPDVIAEVQPIADDWSRVNTVIVVINLPLLDKLYSDATTADLEADLDRILAHEVYGHAIPYLLAGHLSGRCADPLPGQRATESCAIQRENVIRNELRLGQRREYGLDGLTVARRYRH